MSSTIDNITCPKCGGNAQRETDHKTGEVYDHCTVCKYEEVITEGQKSTDDRPTDDEIIERVSKVFFDTLSREEFIEEANRILGTNYTIEDIIWTD